MSNNLKPWFREDLTNTMVSVYFSSLISRPRKQQMSDDYRTGFAAAVSGIALAIGVNPETILESEDLRLLREQVNQR